jgi:PP-loop superfamily ATP-utilizing enzyme
VLDQIRDEKLRRIAKAEQTIRKLTGVQQLRVGDHDGLARIEVGKDEQNYFSPLKL